MCFADLVRNAYRNLAMSIRDVLPSHLSSAWDGRQRSWGWYNWSDLLDIHYLKKDAHVFPEGIDDIALRQVFVKLVRRLAEIHGMNVIVLVDEYDAPMNVAFKSEDDRQRRANFFRGFFSAVLKDNPAVRKALLVGVFEIRGASILSGLNNLKVLTVAKIVSVSLNRRSRIV